MKVLIGMVFVLVSLVAGARDIHEREFHDNDVEAERLHEEREYNENLQDYNNNQYNYDKYQEQVENAQIQAEQKAAHNAAVEEANKKAEEKNKERNEALDMQATPSDPSYQSQFQSEETVQEGINPDDYKNSAQLVIGDQHLYGVTEAKSFEGDKVLVKSASGTFAFPVKMYKSAKKINFDGVVTK